MFFFFFFFFFILTFESFQDFLKNTIQRVVYTILSPTFFCSEINDSASFGENRRKLHLYFDSPSLVTSGLKTAFSGGGGRGGGGGYQYLFNSYSVSLSLRLSLSFCLSSLSVSPLCLCLCLSFSLAVRSINERKKNNILETDDLECSNHYFRLTLSRFFL